MNFKSIGLFKGWEKCRLVVGLLLSKLMTTLNGFENIRSQKALFDTLNTCGLKIKRIEDTLKISNQRDTNIYLRLYSSDLKVYQQVFEYREYKPIVNLIKENGAENDIRVIIDAGANIGLSSIYLYRSFPKAYFYIVEPYHLNFKQLILNVTSNIPEEQYVLIEKAIWSKNEKLDIENKFRDGLEWSKSVKPLKEDHGKSFVEGIPLYELCKDGKIETIDLLKIDIEGAEESVFLQDDNINKVLKMTRFIAIEIHNECCDEKRILKVLDENKFLLKKINETFIGINKSFYPDVPSYCTFY